MRYDEVIEHVAARKPEAENSLPYLVFVQIDGGTWFKARETRPCSSRVYCHRLRTWMSARSTSRAHRRVRLSAARPGRRSPPPPQGEPPGAVRLHARGRPMIFWQTAKAAA